MARGTMTRNPKGVTRVWRVVSPRWVESAFDGEGARRYGARWNTPGTGMVYTASHLSLAVLEILVHAEDPKSLGSFMAIPADVPGDLIEMLEPLPVGWRDANSSSAKLAGDTWQRGRQSFALRVPSVILPEEFNVLINPEHPEFKKLVIGEARILEIDVRLKR